MMVVMSNDLHAKIGVPLIPKDNRVPLDPTLQNYNALLAARNSEFIKYKNVRSAGDNVSYREWLSQDDDRNGRLRIDPRSRGGR
jgi:hypothetical protein